MSVWYERIKRFYDRELWSLEQVKDGVKTATITTSEYQLITGQVYEPSA
ncbi:XkdX family protein [Bacillus sp. FJAT-26390]|nr:XkdX family protein [Bacillus sp. FJAT-26390]